MKIGIYKITNITNNKSYIGSSTDIKNRWKKHRYLLNKNIHNNSYLQRSWNKHTSSNFEFSILEITTIEKLQDRENYWCEIFESHISNRGYNLAAVIRGGVVSKEHIIHKRNNCQNKKRVYVTTRKGEIVNVFSSHRHAAKILNTVESHIHFLTKGKVCLFKNQFLLWDTIFISQKMIEDRLKVRNKTRMKKVYQFSLSGQLVKSYSSIREASLATKISSISDCLKNKQTHAGGFLWSYTNIPPEDKTFKIYQYSLDKVLLNIFSSGPEAAFKTRSTVRGIRKVLSGERKKHNGFIFSRQKL